MKLLLLMAMLSGAAVAAEPARLDLFTSGTDGYKLFRIPGLIATAKGTLLAFAEARKSDTTDWGATDVVLRQSTDNGRTWSPYRVVSQVAGEHRKNAVALEKKLGAEGQITYNNPLAIAARDGAVHFLFTVENERVFYMRSGDDGATFSTPVEITAVFEGYRPGYAWRVVAPGPGHGIETKKGRLLAPFWMSTGTGGHGHRPSVVSTIYSDDRGRTWQRGSIAVPHNETILNPSETALVELRDGRIQLNGRTESKANRRLVAHSPDGAENWTGHEFVESLADPICMGSLTAHAGVLYFTNPDNLTRGDGREAPGAGRDRKNVTLKTSADDGKTWRTVQVIDAGYSGYSDVAVNRQGEVFVLYERGATGVNHFQPAALTLVSLGRVR
jgi:sialidase-1